MNLRIPRTGVVGLIVTTLAALVSFIYLMGQFGGPELSLSGQYRLSATFPDTKQLSVRSDVDIRGVKVGSVTKIVLNQASATVTFSVDRPVAPVYRDATVQVSEKTLLGEAYIVLDPGHRASGRLPSGATLPASAVQPASVEIDQALNALRPAARGQMIKTLETFAVGAKPAQTPVELGQTLSRLSQVTAQLRRLTNVLHGQEGDISAGVITANTVLAQTASRESELRAIVSNGRATLGALASRDSALQAGLAQLPPLLATARSTLADARPLLRDARPLVGDLAAASGPLRVALTQLPPVTRAANTVLAGLSRFNRAALPVLGLADSVLSLARPVSYTLPPALRNLVTVVSYLNAHRQALAAWFSNTAGIGASRDAKGYFARFFINFDPGTGVGIPNTADFQTNAYTKPGDALNPQPYSGYPRLEPYLPPAAKRR